MSFETAVETLRSGITELCAPYAAGHRGELAFYPSRLRNPIMQVGADRRLLRVTYHGATRIMEPYSLVFKRRKDGAAQEYFYAWDRTGGHSRPGIKTLFHYDIQALDVLGETFEPRYEVTLAKAGDNSQSSYFAGNRGPRGAQGRHPARRPNARTGRTYTIQCPVCSKRFARSSRTTGLNPHKNPWGSPCPGRRGFVVSVQ